MFAEWIDDFVAFKAFVDEHLGPRPEGHSIDRIENYENYEPFNLKWSTQSEQNHNSRRSRIEKAVSAVLLRRTTEI
jgi:hypothetical protein